jgi:hypothetical protein
MKGLLLFIGMSAGGAVGWWLGMFSGLALATVLSAVGSGLGLWLTRKLAEDYLE